MVLTVLLCAIGSALCALLGTVHLAAVAAERRRIAAAVTGDDRIDDAPLIERANRRFRRTRLGQLVERELVLAGIDQRPLVVVLVAAGVGLGAAYVLWTALAPVFGVLGLSLGALALRAFIRRAKARRLEAFIVQMPELARVLANATSAGLSITSAIAIAGDELAAPAGPELRSVANSMRFGADLVSALDDMGKRLPSREVAVLLSTLVVCARSGGSLVTSLRDIANTLEARKETRREIRTTLAQALATGYLVIVLGVGMLFFINMIQPGSVEKMTGHIAGQIALVVSGSLFALGFFLIRKMTRFDI
ncbi:type II secretion system F family protein [Nocardioides sp. zg-DK7169]|uniref:type II secretion system F family protein n=1 Tax=Nocardioides sp. zg-DK7169 TaxID=2736600 RepID=UPI001551CC2E|nr:type II secretion protein F [Nocardioides sp. zg-DK7169]